MIPEFSYAGFVWTSYLITAVVLAWQAFQPLQRHRRLMQELREDLLAEELKHHHDPHS